MEAIFHVLRSVGDENNPVASPILFLDEAPAFLFGNSMLNALEADTR